MLGVIGVSLFVVAAWRRLLQSRINADPALVALVAIVVVGVFVVVFWWAVHRSRARQVTVATLRPGWQLHGVWADESLGRELITQGVWEPGLRPNGPRATATEDTKCDAQHRGVPTSAKRRRQHDDRPRRGEKPRDSPHRFGSRITLWRRASCEASGTRRRWKAVAEVTAIAIPSHASTMGNTPSTARAA